MGPFVHPGIVFPVFSVFRSVFLLFEDEDPTAMRARSTGLFMRKGNGKLPSFERRSKPTVGSRSHSRFADPHFQKIRLSSNWAIKHLIDRHPPQDDCQPAGHGDDGFFGIAGFFQ